MRTVVTGGAGFIGSNLVRRLLEQGREVVVADDFSRGSLQNLLDLGIQPSEVGLDPTHPAVDLRDFSQALKVTQGASVVFHLAARIGSIDYLHGSHLNELLALQANLVIDANVFRACLEHNVSKIVYASSTAVYPIDWQHQPGVVLSEADLELPRIEGLTINPEGGYGWAKLMGEVQLGWMSDTLSGIARIFNVYGVNQDLVRAVHVIPALFLKAERYPEEEFIVWGNGQQTRDFLYVTDCIDALLHLEEKASYPPLVANIGSGEAVSIQTIAEKVVALGGKNIPIQYDPSKPVGPISRTADITRARALLGWQPRVSLD